jgi:hypothetical protein
MQVLLEYLDIDPAKVRAVRLLPLCLEAAEDFLEEYSGHRFENEVAATKVIPTRRKTFVRVPSLRALTSIDLDGVALQPGLGYDEPNFYQRMPATHIKLLQYPSAWLPGRLSLTGDWGWYPTPSGVADCGYRLASRMYHERQATYSDAVATAEGGMLQYFRLLPATVQAQLDLIRIRKWGVVSL